MSDCVAVRDITIGAGGDGFDPRARQIRHSRQRLATAAAFLRSCVAHQALSRGDRPCHSLHANTESIIKIF